MSSCAPPQLIAAVLGAVGHALALLGKAINVPDSVANPGPTSYLGFLTWLTVQTNIVCTAFYAAAAAACVLESDALGAAVAQAYPLAFALGFALTLLHYTLNHPNPANREKRRYYTQAGYKYVELASHLEHAAGSPLALLFACAYRLPAGVPAPSVLDPVGAFMLWYIGLTCVAAARLRGPCPPAPPPPPPAGRAEGAVPPPPTSHPTPTPTPLFPARTAAGALSPLRACRPPHPIMSHPVLSRPTLSHPVPSRPTRSHPIPSHHIPSHPTPPHPVPSHPVPSHPVPIAPPRRAGSSTTGRRACGSTRSSTTRSGRRGWRASPPSSPPSPRYSSAVASSARGSPACSEA